MLMAARASQTIRIFINSTISARKEHRFTPTHTQTLSQTHTHAKLIKIYRGLVTKSQLSEFIYSQFTYIWCSQRLHTRLATYRLNLATYSASTALVRKSLPRIRWMLSKHQRVRERDNHCRCYGGDCACAQMCDANQNHLLWPGWSPFGMCWAIWAQMWAQIFFNSHEIIDQKLHLTQWRLSHLTKSVIGAIWDAWVSVLTYYSTRCMCCCHLPRKDHARFTVI